jgi:N-acetylmuramate 1-kinase
MSAEREAIKAEFLRNSGWGDASLHPLPGDASTRHYARLVSNGRTALLMDQPQSAETPSAPANATADQRRKLGYNAVARLAGADCSRFVAVSNYLKSLSLSAPEIYALDSRNGFVLIEDLGDDLYTDVLARGADERLLYGTAAELLAGLHTQPAPSLLPPDKPLHRYDDVALVAEADLLIEWFIPVALGRAATTVETDTHRELWRSTLQPILQSPPVFVHRDFHAQNLIWLFKRTGTARVGLIDFQDAVAGPQAYDLISLVEDARRDVSEAVAAATTQRYLDALSVLDVSTDEAQFRGQMAIMAAQRNVKIVGIFSRLAMRDRKPRYLDYLPRVWRYLEKDLEHPALAALRQFYDRVVPARVRGPSQAVAV